jgi:Uncharacterised nucleotidyltransferase
MTELLEPPEAIARIATFGVPDVGYAGAFTVTDDRWPDLWNGFRNERLGGLAVAALDAGALKLPDKRRDQIVRRHRQDMVRCLGLEQTLLNLAEVFQEAGIEFVVLKGPALAHSLYPDPSWRPFIDIDLLVRTRDWRAACRVLEGRGCTRRLPEPRPGFDVRFGKAAVHVTPEGYEVDLHRTLVVGPYGLWMQPDELFDRTEKFVLAGRPLRRLDDTGLLLHACVHAALGQQAPFGQQLRDIRQVVERGSIDVRRLHDWAIRWRLAPVFRRAFELEAEATGMAWPTWLQPLLKLRCRGRDRRLLDAYATERRSRGGTAVATLQAIPGIRSRLEYIRALMYPRSEFMSHRTQQGTISRLRRVTVPLGWFTQASWFRGSRSMSADRELR